MVDWRSGEIRDPRTAAWLLDAVRAAMAHCTNERVLAFRQTLYNHRHHFLTFLTWLHEDLRTWRNDRWLHFRNPDDVRPFERIAAQLW